MMKKGKKLISVLLALALVGQIGTIVGMAENEDENLMCSHGMNPVQVVGSCTGGVHWISGGADLSGGSGINFFYPNENTKTIRYGTGPNIIIIDSSLAEKGGALTITYFSEEEKNKIIVPSDEYKPSSEELGQIDGDGVYGRELNIGEYGISLLEGPEDPNDPSPYLKSVIVKSMSSDYKNDISPFDFGLEKSNTSVTLKGVEGDYTYIWEITQGGTPKRFVQRTAPKPSSPGPCTYKCTVVDNYTGDYETTGPITIGCSVKHQFDQQLTLSGDGGTQDLSNAVQVTGTKEYTLKGVSFTTEGALCYDHGSSDVKHGYKETWKVEPAVEGAEIKEGNKLVLTGEDLLTTGQDITLSVTVKRQGNGFTSEESDTKTFPAFQVIGEKVPTVLPNEGGDGDKPTDNPPGEGDNIPGEGDNIPGEGDNIPGEGDNIPGEGDNTPSGDNGNTNGDDTPAPSETPTEGSWKLEDLTIGSGEESPGGNGTGGDSEVDHQLTVDRNTSGTVASHTYSTNVPAEQKEYYDFIWELETDKGEPALNNSKYGYISMDAKEGTAATVTVSKSDIPAGGVNEIFVLRVTVKEKVTKGTLSMLSVLPLNDTEPASKVREFRIRIFAAPKATVPSGSSGTSGSSGGSSSSSKSDAKYNSWYEWQTVQRDIEKAKKGAMVKASMGTNTDMPVYVFNALRGEDLSLQMRISGGYTWTINGKSLQKPPANQIWIDFGVKSYTNSKMTSLCRESKIKSFELENTGSYYGDMRLTMNLGSAYAKKTVYLYSYDENNNKLTYSSSAKAADNGDVDFVFTKSLGAYVVTSKALYGENPVTGGGGIIGGGNKPAAVYPPVVTTPAYQTPPSSQTSSESSSESGSESTPSSEEAESSKPSVKPVENIIEPEPEPEEEPFPILVPLLILSIAGVITATVLVVNNSRNKGGFGIQ